MRILVGWLVVATLWAGPAPDLPQPGRNQAFLLQVMGNSEGGSTPWRTYQTPPITASAVVEVVGYLSPEELRQATFEEFLAWFYQDLRKFLRLHGGHFASNADLTSATMPVERFGGNPVPKLVPIGRGGD